ncbi:SMI1/KNR4 family protein [Kribbella sp. NPDC051587]|uniref:SMI1/KNR4 family protein n=1 Tax=Kribbella sp. NPDC051587 TaxID=3364119 RepID=UPI0037913D50
MSVATSWDRIVGWLAANHPATVPHINPPATAVDLRYLQAAMNRPLPTDLVEYLQIADGTNHRYVGGYLIPPFYNLLPIMDMLSARKIHQEIRHRIDGTGPWASESEPAGQRPTNWLDSFLPVAGAYDGGLLFVDLRDGDQFGCISEWDEGVMEPPPRWSGVGEMLDEVASALVDGHPAPTKYHSPDLPQVNDGYLRWGDVPA